MPKEQRPQPCRNLTRKKHARPVISTFSARNAPQCRGITAAQGGKILQVQGIDYEKRTSLVEIRDCRHRNRGSCNALGAWPAPQTCQPEACDRAGRPPWDGCALILQAAGETASAARNNPRYSRRIIRQTGPIGPVFAKNFDPAPQTRHKATMPRQLLAGRSPPQGAILRKAVAL